jgi:hypothetical protein
VPLCVASSAASAATLAVSAALQAVKAGTSIAASPVIARMKVAPDMDPSVSASVVASTVIAGIPVAPNVGTSVSASFAVSPVIAGLPVVATAGSGDESYNQADKDDCKNEDDFEASVEDECEREEEFEADDEKDQIEAEPLSEADQDMKRNDDGSVTAAKANFVAEDSQFLDDADPHGYDSASGDLREASPKRHAIKHSMANVDDVEFEAVC